MTTAPNIPFPSPEPDKPTIQLNGLRHSITAQVSVLPETERAALEKFCRGIVASLAPGSALEIQVARGIAESHWRLNRIRSVEDNFFAWQVTHSKPDIAADGHDQIEYAMHQARAFAERGAHFDRLALYEQRLKRALVKDLQMFNEIKDRRLAVEAKALEQAPPLRQPAAQAETLHSESEAKANNGFARSNEQIDAVITHQDRLNEARADGQAPAGPPASKPAARAA